MKPSLARGKIKLIGATTLAEYRKYIEKDGALERRFQPVAVEEPSRLDTLAILRGLKEKYESFHSLSIADDAIVSAVDMSMRYIGERKLPDKAIDLLDEAASSVKMRAHSRPVFLDKLEKEIRSAEIEKASLLPKENSERIEELKKEIAQKREEFSHGMEHYKQMQQSRQKIQSIREDLHDLEVESQKFEMEGNYQRAAEIRYVKIPEKQKILSESEEKNTSYQRVNSQDVAAIIAKWTGIPAGKLLKTESEIYLDLENILSQKLISQNEAIKKVSEALRRSKAGLSDENRPIASFLFLGPTGVGKTEMAKALCEVLWNDPNAYIRLDMSEYMEAHAVSRLIGSPPGYIGHEDGGQLTEAVRRHPYSVILLDEVEKAHPDVYNIFLQILDEGKITDAKGRTVDMRNTIIIMTSNIGSESILENRDKKVQNSKVREALFSFFRPEFINRIDDIIIFESLSKNDMIGIAKLMLDDLKKRLKNQNISVDFSENALKKIADLGYDPVMGARPLRRAIVDFLINPLSREILEENILPGENILVDMDEKGGIILQK